MEFLPVSQQEMMDRGWEQCDFVYVCGDTFEDTDDEPVEHVCQDMLESVTNPDLDARIILDRTKAVESTVAIDRRNPNRLHIILIIGKGNERWFKDHGKHIPFEGDDHIVKRIFGLA